MSKAKSKFRKGKAAEGVEKNTSAADQGEDLLCCVPDGQGTVETQQHDETVAARENILS